MMQKIPDSIAEKQKGSVLLAIADWYGKSRRRERDGWSAIRRCRGKRKKRHRICGGAQV